MADRITREQFEDLENARFFDRSEYHKLLEEYVAGNYIKLLEEYVAGNYIGDSENSDTRGLLALAYMGEHKHNPTAIAAKNGELPPKQKPLSKRERDRLLYAKIQERLYAPFFYADMEEIIDATD